MTLEGHQDRNIRLLPFCKIPPGPKFRKVDAEKADGLGGDNPGGPF